MATSLQPTDPLGFREIVLDRLKVGGTGRISREVLHHAKVNVVAEHMADAITVRIEAEVLGEQIAEDITLVDESPADWHSHLILSLPERSWRRDFLTYLWGPPKLTRKTHTVTAAQRMLLPHADVALPPQLGSKVCFATLENPRYYEEVHPDG